MRLRRVKLLIPLLLLGLSSCSGSRYIEKSEILDVTSRRYPYGNTDDPELEIFDEYGEFNDFLNSIHQVQFGENISYQKLEVQQWLNGAEDHFLFVVYGTFGTSDTPVFSYLPEQFFCEIVTSVPATEGLVNSFYAVYIQDPDLIEISEVSFVCDRTIAG